MVETADRLEQSAAKTASMFIEMRGISKRFGGVRALIDVSFAIRRAEIHCLAGENGCGKSTLIKILAGIHSPDAGEIIVDQQTHSHLSPAASQHAGIRIIYQDLSLFPNLSVAENISFQNYAGTAIRLASRGAMRKEASAVMERLGVSLLLDELVGTLPIATRQLVAICRALTGQARLIVMDEPTASLTHQEVDSLLATIHTLKAHGIATVFVSHRLEEVMKIAERVTVLRDGCNVGTYLVRDLDRRRLGDLVSGQTVERSIRSRFASDAAPVLEIRGLTRKGQYAIDFVLRPGEILGITGRLGSGRTELALSLFGMNPPDAGEILLDGKPIRLRDSREAISHGIGYVSEDRLSIGLVMPQSIADNTIVSVLERLLGRMGLIDQRKRSKTIDHWTNELHIKTKTTSRPVRELSGGNQQRVVLAKWLATAPRVLILDSPTVGVDIGARAGIYQIVDMLAARGLAVILISDEVEEVVREAHRIYVMLSGRITRIYDTNDVTEHEVREAIDA